jgi:YihY family inner membrane protein
MATETKTQASALDTKHEVVTEAEQTPKKEVKTLKEFFTKFNNDWVMNFASGLAFNLLTSIFPIVIAIISIAGFFVGSLDPTGKQMLIQQITNAFPPPISNQNVLEPALNSLSKQAGILSIIAILLAIFGGSRLFVSMESYFDIIYHTRPRDVIPQNIMAVLMLLLFVVLIPVMVFAATLPALVVNLLKVTPLNTIPYIGLLFALIGILGGIFVAWIFFEAVYIVVPNQRISFRNSWIGALVAAIALQIYLTLFPFYVSHFLTSDTGTVGFAIILLFFFYYFAVILLLGAEINAYFAEGVRVTPDNLAVMVHKLTSHLATSEQDVQKQASASHKDEEPKSIRPKHEATATAQSKNGTAVQPGAFDEQTHTEQATHTSKKKQSTSQGSSRMFALIEAVAGTALAFVVTLFRMRSKK